MVKRTSKVSCSVGGNIFSSMPNSKPNRVLVFPLVAFFFTVAVRTIEGCWAVGTAVT